ncbi:MAG: serine/threonine protein kinase [Streptosporangiaceae bacterium]|nr:serine/threonine protein kinase [Streptosporangiaceae bacterium]
MDQKFTAEDVLQMSGATAAKYLGTGTFGETWRLDIASGEPVARKFLHRTDSDVERLDREVEGLRRVSSPQVVSLLEVGEGRLDGRRIPYLDFEFIEGGDLDDWLRRGEGIGDDAIQLAAGLLQGVGALHEAQVLHRDIKPANIGLRGGDPGNPVLLDLGLAKLLDFDTITRYPALMGTFMYASPEQLRHQRANRGSDVWAVGVVLHEVLSGRHPFFRLGEQLTLPEAIARVEESAPPPLPEDTHPALVELVGRCLQPEPYQRGSAAAAHRRLSRKVDT